MENMHYMCNFPCTYYTSCGKGAFQKLKLCPSQFQLVCKMCELMHCMSKLRIHRCCIPQTTIWDRTHDLCIANIMLYK